MAVRAHFKKGKWGEGLLYFYNAEAPKGCLEILVTYCDLECTIPHTHPIISSIEGNFPDIFLPQKQASGKPKLFKGMVR